MACRVRIRLRRNDKVIETSALVNSGFETDSPDIVIPVELAKRLNLWPPMQFSITVLETGGGEIAAPYHEQAVELELVLSDREPKKCIVNVLIDPHVREVLLSDYVASVLGISLIDLKKGIWRLVDDPLDKFRETVEPEEW